MYETLPNRGVLVQVSTQVWVALNALGVSGLASSVSGYLILPPKYEVLEIITESAYGTQFCNKMAFVVCMLKIRLHLPLVS